MYHNNLSHAKKRFEWVDSLKAIGMICIVIGHALNGVGIWKQLYGFHVPLFIAVSGMLYNPSSLKFKKYIKNKFKRIMVPYYFGSIISIGVYISIGKYIEEMPLTLRQCLYGMLWANGENGYMKWNLPLWYLPMFFLIQVFSYFVIKKNNTVYLLKVLFASVVIGSSLYYSGIVTNLFMGLETAIYLYPFFVIGKLINTFLKADLVHKNKRIISLVGILNFVLGIILISIQRNVDYVSDEYRNYFVFLIAATCVIFAITIFCDIHKLQHRLLLIIGENTLVILLFHKFPILFFEKVCPGLKYLYSINPEIWTIIITPVAIMLCLMLERGFSNIGFFLMEKCEVLNK